MAQKFTELSSTVTTSRLQYAAVATCHLSDGSCVFIEQDNTSYYVKHSGADHATVSTIATFAIPGNTNPISLGICADSADNLYLTELGVPKATFTKGAGYTWTQHGGGVDGIAWVGGVPIWCNTGGGTGGLGHILVVGYNSTPVPRYAIYDAGALLASAINTNAVAATASGNSPTFLGSTGASGASDHVDVEGDGFGAASGLAIIGHTLAGTISVGAWSVTSAGALSTNSMITAALATGALSGGSANGRISCLRVSANLWAIGIPSATTAGGYAIARYSSTAQLTAPVDAGSPTNMPLNSGGGNANIPYYDMVRDPSTPNKVWVIAPGALAGGNIQVYRIAAALGSGVTWDTVATADDLITGVNTVQASFRAVSKPRGSRVDWQMTAKITATNWALLGDYTQFPNVRTHQMLL